LSLTVAQQELRRTRLTGSTIAALLGRSPWSSPLEAWELQHGLREFAGNDDTEAGEFMEEGIGRLTMAKLDIDLTQAITPGTLLHPRYPDIFAATPDLVIPSERLGIQIKNHTPWAMRRYRGAPLSAGRWDNALVPEDKLMQCLLELEIVGQHYGPAGWDMWFLAAFFGGSRLRAYWIRRDSATIEAMLSAGARFWRRHLDPAGPQEAPSPECDCGGCGRGERWWVGAEPIPAPRVKLSPAEIAAAPLPFGEEELERFGPLDVPFGGAQ
jgi:hypothetical protein